MPLSEEQIAEVFDLLSKQKNPTISWVATITQISEETLAKSLTELGLLIDGDKIIVDSNVIEKYLVKDSSVNGDAVVSTDSSVSEDQLVKDATRDPNKPIVFRPGIHGIRSSIGNIWNIVCCCMGIGFLILVAVIVAFAMLDFLFMVLFAVAAAVSLCASIINFILQVTINRIKIYPDRVEQKTPFRKKVVLYDELITLNTEQWDLVTKQGSMFGKEISRKGHKLKFSFGIRHNKSITIDLEDYGFEVCKRIQRALIRAINKRRPDRTELLGLTLYK